VATQFDTIFAVLQRTGVRYVVVGGVAVNLHGYQRFTKDVDLVIELFADPAIREGWIRDKGMMVFQMYSDQTRMSIDIFVRYPLDFDELWDQCTKIDLPGTSLRIASIDHLILMKRKVSRPQDLLDIEQLEKIKRLLDEQAEAPP